MLSQNKTIVLFVNNQNNNKIINKIIKVIIKQSICLNSNRIMIIKVIPFQIIIISKILILKEIFDTDPHNISLNKGYRNNSKKITFNKIHFSKTLQDNVMVLLYPNLILI